MGVLKLISTQSCALHLLVLLLFAMEHPERKWEEEEEEVVGLQQRRSTNIHGDIDKDQATPEFPENKTDGASHFSNQKLLLKIPYEDQSRSNMILNKNTGEDAISIKEVADFDVEAVLEKQETYDLICPHCDHVITKKVILRRRDVEGQGSAGSIGSPTHSEHPVPNTDVFRCSECLRFFARLGRDCFSLFGGSKVVEPSTISEIRIVVDPPIVPGEVSEVGERDILKSIVYGGLAESITSLGIVSSAAGAAAATLNIMGLALANLIGGLLVIAHNLRELRNDSSAEGSSIDRYRDTLGRRDKFKVQAAVVILSFLIFGAIPPIVYGFSFRESDDKDLKLAVVAASSLLCITLLATGKAHVQNPPKPYFKTILYYVTIGFMASGVSYVAGNLFDRLLKYLGLFESTSATNVSIQETKLGQQGWAYY